MARITIAGDAVVVTSTLKYEDIRTIEKYRPEALTLKGGEDGKEPIFRISAANGVGSINKYGASFGASAHNEGGFATITMVVEGVEGDIREYVADQLGAAVRELNKLEETLPATLAEIKAEKEAIMADITVM